MWVHTAVVASAGVAVVAAAFIPAAAQERDPGLAPAFSVSGVTGASWDLRQATFLRPEFTITTRESTPDLVQALPTPDPSSPETIRPAGSLSPATSLSSGVSVVAASSGEEGAGVKPLADIVDPRKPFVLYEAQPGDSASKIAEQYTISLRTLLENNPTVAERSDRLIQRGQQLIVPRKDGILYKVGHGDTVDTIVAQYDNITAGTVVEYRPNNISDPKNLKAGDFVLLPGATIKPPPPPPPEPPKAPTRPGAAPGSSGATAPGAPVAGGAGRFGYPLGDWHGVSDPFGVPRGGGSYHTGIDLDLFGRHHSSIFSACDGVVTKTEYLTYSYGYHVVVDCGDGWSTLYAHMDRIDVAPGQRVGRGAPLGISGLTGFTTGEHLHFEIRLNGAPVNPADYLAF
ncbi:MAG: peptidoglycan DD-metalloendopeptidase family protein [Dehalococcoidia bacterium]